MADQIRVLIVDDIPETRDHLTKLLGFESDIDVVGSAASGAEAIALATSLTPDVVLMDINMPDMDGIAATELLGRAVPTASVVMMSVQGEADYLRRSMLAGAREFLVKPFSSDELTASIRQVHTREREKASRLAIATPTESSGPVGTNPSGEPGLVVALFSPKGGVGRTTVAVNMAVAAATELGKKVVLVDGSFQFGDVGVLLNLNPKNKSIADLVPELEQAGVDVESIDTFVINHSAGIRVLLAPPSPEMAELITPSGIKRVIEALRLTHDLVVVDCTAFFNDTTLAILDAADMILTMLSLEITSIKNMRLFLEVAEQLGYERQGPAHPQPRRIRRSGSASRTSSIRSAVRLTRRSSATGGAWSTRSIGGFRSSSATGRRRSPRTSSDWPSQSSARSRRSRPPRTRPRPPTRNRCSHGADRVDRHR